MADVLEAALHGERGRGEDDGGNLVEDELVEELGDVDGRGLEEGGAAIAGEMPVAAMPGLKSRSVPLPTWARRSIQ